MRQHDRKECLTPDNGDSSAIGAGVDFIFAIISDGAINGVTRVRMVGLPSRGAQPPTLNLIAFPALIDLGKFTLEDKPPQTDVDRVVEYVEKTTRANRASIQKELKGMSNGRKTKAVNEAVEKSRLIEDKDGCLRVEKSHPGSGDDAISFFDHPDAGMSGVGTDQEPPF